jgi:cbb3-type cytochrome c oxidase subunit I
MSAMETSPAKVESKLLAAHTLAALLMVLHVGLLGLVVAAKFHWPDLLTEAGWLTWGRVRYAHTQGMLFGWLGNAFLAFLYHAVPRLADRPVTSRGLGWLLFVLWNFAVVIPGWVCVHMGYSQAVEFAEFPLEIDVVLLVALFLSCVQFVVPLLRSKLGQLYVSGWYIVGGLVFTLLAFPVGNFVPEVEAGARGATYSGLWIHDAIGLYVTPLAVAMAYLVIPAVTGRPIFSHFLSLVGFWLLFLVYPLNGTHHYVFSSIPMDAQKGAIVASVYLGVDVILVVANLLLSMRGSAAIASRDVPLRFIWLGVVFYLVVSLQGSMQALMPVNRFTHFSDWVIGHSHLALVGFASFIAIGGLLHAWRSQPGFRYNPSAASWGFWLLTTGLLISTVDLTIAGLVQGHSWQSDAAWLDSVRASRPYWLTRTLAGVPMLLGFGAVVLSVLTGTRGVPITPTEEEAAPVSPEPMAGVLAWLQRANGVLAVAGVGFFVLSFYALAVLPNQTLQATIDATRPSTTTALSANELHGRSIYMREGCGYCHSQLIRSTEDDVRRFGIASRAWESAEDRPQQWGTRRVGPDLSRQRGKRPRDWNLAHLYNPRHIVPDSNMPAYPYLFAGDVKTPTREALDLVAYLETLGRDAQLAGLDGPSALSNMDPEDEKRLGMFCDCGIPRRPGSPMMFRTSREPSERQRFERLGRTVFVRECSGCHSKDGDGDGPGSVTLLPRVRDLTAARYSDRALSRILWEGVPGTAMPGWHELPARELRGVATYIQSLGEPEASQEILSPSERDMAQKLFAANCQNCHGIAGVPGTLAASVVPLPTNFREIRPTRAYAEKVLAEGVIGTSMASQKTKFSDEERRLLARFVRTLYVPE